MKTALSQIRSFNVNEKKRQARNLFYIKNLARSQAKAKRRSLVVTLQTIKSLAVTYQTIIMHTYL